MRPPVRVVFVCSGNICRSPMAEVVLTRQAEASDRAGLITVRSVGTGGWHVGDEMDRRSRHTLIAAGYEWGRHAAQQLTLADLDDHDVVVALDSGHYAELRDMADASEDPDVQHKIVLLRRFDPTAADDLDVADPYYGGAGGFTDVLAQIERGCAGLLDAVARAVAVDGPLQQPDSPPR